MSRGKSEGPRGEPGTVSYFPGAGPRAAVHRPPRDPEIDGSHELNSAVPVANLPPTPDTGANVIPFVFHARCRTHERHFGRWNRRRARRNQRRGLRPSHPASGGTVDSLPSGRPRGDSRNLKLLHPHLPHQPNELPAREAFRRRGRGSLPPVRHFSRKARTHWLPRARRSCLLGKQVWP